MIPVIRLLLATLLVLLLYALGAVAQAQNPKPLPSPSPDSNPYIRKNSIGVIDTAPLAKKDAFTTRHISEFVGERFIFMPRQTQLQRYGYQLIHPIDDSFGKLPYQDYVGKIVKVVGVSQDKDIESRWEVNLVVEGTGEKLLAEAYSEAIDSLANLQDIEDARAKFVGKTLVYKDPILRRYNAITDKTEYFIVPKNSLVKVVDVVVSWDSDAPARFILETPSGEGFVDVNMSGTNIPKILRKHNRFDDTFHLP